MIAVTQVRPQITLEEFLEDPETKPYSEYINGKIEQKPIILWNHRGRASNKHSPCLAGNE